MATGTSVTLGNLELAAPFARATLPNQPVAGGFLTITNTGEVDDTLIAASSPVAGRVEVHEMEMDGEIMRMRELEGGLSIPAGETVSLKSGGYHLMFMDLAAPLVEGDSADVTLTFEEAGDALVTMPVVAREAANAKAHDGHGSH